MKLKDYLKREIADKTFLAKLQNTNNSEEHKRIWKSMLGTEKKKDNKFIDSLLVDYKLSGGYSYYYIVGVKDFDWSICRGKPNPLLEVLMESKQYIFSKTVSIAIKVDLSRYFRFSILDLRYVKFETLNHIAIRVDWNKIIDYHISHGYIHLKKVKDILKELLPIIFSTKRQSNNFVDCNLETMKKLIRYGIYPSYQFMYEILEKSSHSSLANQETINFINSYANCDKNKFGRYMHLHSMNSKGLVGCYKFEVFYIYLQKTSDSFKLYAALQS